MRQEYTERIAYTNKSKSFENYLKWSNEKDIIFSEIRKYLNSSFKTMLDIGAGDGSLTKIFSPLFQKVVVIEPAEKFIPELKKNLNNYTADIINDKFENIVFNEKFDFILLCHSAYYLNNFKKELGRIKEILADKGLLVIVNIATKGGFQEFIGIFNEEITGKKYSPLITTEEIAYSLKELGFRAKEITVNPSLKIPSIDDTMSMLDFCYNVDINEIKDVTKKKIKTYLIRRFNQGHVTFKVPQSIILATK